MEYKQRRSDSERLSLSLSLHIDIFKFKTLNAYIPCLNNSTFGNLSSTCICIHVKVTFVYKVICCSIVCNKKALIYKSALNPKYVKWSHEVWVVIFSILLPRDRSEFDPLSIFFFSTVHFYPLGSHVTKFWGWAGLLVGSFWEPFKESVSFSL